MIFPIRAGLSSYVTQSNEHFRTMACTSAMVTTSARLPKRSPTTSERSPRAPASSIHSHRRVHLRDYIERGCYEQQLSFIAQLRPGTPTLVVFSEKLFANDAESLSLLHSFLGLSEPELSEFTWLNRGQRSAPLDPETGECLEAYFSARNAGLSELLQTEQFLTIDPNGWPDWVQRIRTMP